ncbi:hypothetical protein H310_01559 [Aphanomyces invadans]|uniref:Uncharacterized protein n=1 Tax=Aphanomyces invadans TaxID=157072 RepID=A0A024US14_9STRA|nr:hypothetical protein H310_01559 [Aphanomyces invadans]ETW09109.1 hypothetical protein H310_01559 [Aphanomyces invadans]|eukprot:XP_008862914.1 hypothetical protein H310_01559 [Aphanomyces invadans]
MWRGRWLHGVVAAAWLVMAVAAQKDATTFYVIGPSANQTETTRSLHALFAHEVAAFTLTMEPYALSGQNNNTQWVIPTSELTTTLNESAPRYTSYEVMSDDTDPASLLAQVVVLDESQLFLSISNCTNGTSLCDSIAPRQTEQMIWLNETLSKNQAPWLFVVGQFPLCYRDRKGHYQNLHAILVPLFTAFQVDAYFGMNDLVSQVVRLHVDTSNDFVSYTYGAASIMPYMDMLSSCESSFRVPAGNTTITKHAVSRNSMEVTMYDSQGGVIFRTGQTRLRKKFEVKGSVGPAEYIPWLTGAAVVLTIGVAVLYGLKFKGKRIDYRYNPCFKRQVARVKGDDDGSSIGSHSNNELPTDADAEDEDEFEMEFSSDDDESDVVSRAGATL